MIPKVNRPTHLKLVSQTKSTENDPGSSQGGGVAYENLQQQNQNEKKSEAALTSVNENASEKKNSDEFSSENASSQIGLSSVVLEFRITKKEIDPSPGLNIKYSAIDSVAKGLLLNKKA